MALRTPPMPAEANPGHPAFWRQPPALRAEAFGKLQALGRPVPLEDGSGRAFVALVRHQDVTEASRLPEVFRNAPGATTPPPARWVRAVFGDSMVNLDGAGHHRLRRVVARAFTPRLLARTQEDILATAERIVDRIAPAGPRDFVEAVAAPMPFDVLCTMMGIPGAEQQHILRLIDQASEHVGVHRSVLRRLRSPGRGLRALARMHRVIARIGRERRRSPGEDLISRLVAPDADGNHLNGRELGSFFSLLLVAGVETTRNALAHGLHLLTEHPGQRALLLSDLPSLLPGAVEEIIRHSTPIHQFRRTVARPHLLGGHQFSPGDTVALYYGAANHDESVFADAAAFDITRDPNPHLGFGGGGPHYCLGAHLARQEIHAVLHTLFRRHPGVRATGRPRYTPSAFDHRIAALPFDTGREAPWGT